MTYDDLKRLANDKKVAEVCKVSVATVGAWQSGRVMPPLKHLWALKLRWPDLDLNSVVETFAALYNRYHVSRGQPGLLD